jgi:pheromone shutdown-related protein TraB
MITLIGTGHVFNLSAALLSIFDQKQPDMICVELDNQRYQALIIKQTDPERFEQHQKNLPFMYRLLSRFQDDMASQYGVIPGSEMLTAISYAQSHQLPMEFIDMNGQQIFNQMWRTMPLIERLRLFLSGFAGFFISKKTVEKEMQQMQQNFDQYLEEIGKKFPTITRTLIDERNTYMANRLLQLHEQYTNIIACVGDGHVPGLSRLIKEKNIETHIIRLQELRAFEQKNTDTTSASFSIDYKPS